jgi:hypothetical protein
MGVPLSAALLSPLWVVNATSLAIDAAITPLEAPPPKPPAGPQKPGRRQAGDGLRCACGNGMRVCRVRCLGVDAIVLVARQGNAVFHCLSAKESLLLLCCSCSSGTPRCGWSTPTAATPPRCGTACGSAMPAATAWRNRPPSFAVGAAEPHPP